MFLLTSEQEPFMSHLYLFFPLEENVGKPIKWRLEVSLTLYTQLGGSTGLWPLLLGLLYIYPLHPSNITTVLHVASFGAFKGVLNSPLADRESLGTFICCIYYVRTDRPGLFKHPSSSFSEVCWSLMLNENKACTECCFHRALTQHSEDFGLFLRARHVKDCCFGIEY